VQIPKMGFSEALALINLGRRVARADWGGMWLALQEPDEHSKMTAPYLYQLTETGSYVPWVATHADLLATDWRAIAAGR
jgi:hypothetical protein